MVLSVCYVFVGTWRRRAPRNSHHAKSTRYDPLTTTLTPTPKKKTKATHIITLKNYFSKKRLFKIYEKPFVNFDFEKNDIFGKRKIFINGSGLIVPLCAVGEFKVWVLYGWSLWRHQVTEMLHSCNVYVHLSILLQRSCRGFNNMHVYLRDKR